MANLNLKNDFPIFSAYPDLVYLDTGATSQKPKFVIDRLSQFYERENSNIHRGVYRLSAEATRLYDESREIAARFLNASSAEEVVFVRGVTEGINLVADSLGRKILRPGDEILISEMEHHANIVPWQLIAKKVGATLKAIPVTDSGQLEIDSFLNLLTDKVKVLSLVHVSNALGTVNPIGEIVREAKKKGVYVLVDGAQAVSHLKVDVRELGCDFYVFSGHKVYAPTGIGVLYGRQDILNSLPPYQAGGDMIEEVTLERSTFRASPERFEAGTPNIAGAIALGAALTYLSQFSWEEIREHDLGLISHTKDILKSFRGLSIIGENNTSLGAISFIINGVHPHDIGTVLDSHAICIRAGHHCAQPLMRRFNVPATARVSFGLYNDLNDIKKLRLALEKIYKIFKI